MKKIFTLLFMSLALAANANDFTDDLALTVMGSTTTTETTVSVTQQENGNYTFTLPNLSVKVLVMTVNVGTVVISDIEGVDMGNGNVLLSAEKDIEIQEGDDESVTTWVGTTMGEVPVVFNAVMSEYELNAEMSLSMTYSGMSITAAATFGSAITDEYSGELVATILDATITDT
ncbi:MAG: calycin-like domain-containing protein, partial [Prevotella sp.]|nr:calycin-like domain-containing protein [Prevotella sp.]